MGLITLPSPSELLGAGSPTEAVFSSFDSVPTGVESVYEYNGLIMNNLANLDRIRIYRIEGLGDADVRDSRELNPSRHGETSLNALYGGRTIVLNGRIESFSLNKMRDMQMALRQAFAQLVDMDLTVITGRGFDRDHMIRCRKSQSLQMTEEQKDFNYWRDFMVTLRASDPRILSRQTVTSSVAFPTSVSVAGDSVLQPENKGNFTSQPVIVIRGPMINPEIAINQWQDGAALKMTSVLSDGQERWIDTASRRIYDENGNSRFDEYILGSTWLEMPPGVCDVNLWASNLTGASSITVYHRHSWI